MADRERLLEILNKPIFPHENVDPLEAVADYLLDNGVTFAKDTNVPSWIPVTERLPEKMKDVLVRSMDDFSEVCFWTGYRWEKSWDHEVVCSVAYWMPLPEPPQE